MKNFLRSRNVRLLALACGLLATVFAWYQAGQAVEREETAQFNARANVATAVLERRIQRYLDILYGLQAFAYHTEEITRQDFRQYGRALQLGKRFPGVQAVEFIRRVPLADRDHFLLNLRSDPSMGPVGTSFAIQPPGDREEYWAIDYVEPLATNESVVGLDVLSRPASRAAAERARDFGEPSATGRYRLAQEAGSSYGLVIYLPVFGHAATHAGLLGLVNVVLRVDDMLADTLSDALLGNVRVRIHDLGVVGAATAQTSSATLFYASANETADIPAAWWQSRRAAEKPVRSAWP